MGCSQACLAGVGAAAAGVADRAAGAAVVVGLVDLAAEGLVVEGLGGVGRFEV